MGFMIFLATIASIVGLIFVVRFIIGEKREKRIGELLLRMEELYKQLPREEKIQKITKNARTQNMQEEQRERMWRAVSGTFRLTELDTNKCTCKSQGTSVYTTTLEFCSCPDFRKRQKPCKHMYRLAICCGVDDIPIPLVPDKSTLRDTPFLSYFFAPRSWNGYVSKPEWQFKVTGMNPQTGRINTRTFKASPENVENDMKEKYGLEAPYEILSKEVLKRPPSDQQLSYASDLGCPVLKSMCSDDVSALITRFVDNNHTPPDYRFAIWAQLSGVSFSRCENEKSLQENVCYQLDFREKMSLFCYIVYSRQVGLPIGNMNKSEFLDVYRSFYDYILASCNSVDQFKSYLGVASSLFKPRKNSSQYKAVLDHLAANGAVFSKNA